MDVSDKWGIAILMVKKRFVTPLFWGYPNVAPVGSKKKSVVKDANNKLIQS